MTRLVDAVVFSPTRTPLAELARPSRRFSRLPWIAFAPFRPDDGRLLLDCHAGQVAAGAGRGRRQRGGGRPGGALLGGGRPPPCPGRRAAVLRLADPLQRGSGTTCWSGWTSRPDRGHRPDRGLLAGTPLAASSGPAAPPISSGSSISPGWPVRPRCSGIPGTTPPPSPGILDSPPPVTSVPPPDASRGCRRAAWDRWVPAGCWRTLRGEDAESV